MNQKCNLQSCTLKATCKRFDVAGTITPIMPFLPEGVIPAENEEYTGPLNGCSDYWPVTTGQEWFENNVKKTPKAPAGPEDLGILPNQLSLF